MVDESAANYECIGEVETRHGCKLVDVLTTNPDTLGMILTNSVVEAKFLGQKAWWHARVETEDEESGKVAQSHGTSSNSKGCMIRSGIVIP